MKKISFLLFLITFIACNYKIPGEKFTKALWAEKEDWDFPKRDLILNDLIKNHKIVGLNYKQIIDSLDEPENWKDVIDSMSYPIITDFGSNIDPVHTKYLIIKLNKDSVATSFKIIECNK